MLKHERKSGGGFFESIFLIIIGLFIPGFIAYVILFFAFCQGVKSLPMVVVLMAIPGLFFAYVCSSRQARFFSGGMLQRKDVGSKSGSHPSKQFEIKQSPDTVFDFLENSLAGVSVEPSPGTDAIWRLQSSDRDKLKIAYRLEIRNPRSVSHYARCIDLHIDLFELDGKVFINRFYKASSPMMNRETFSVAEQTDPLLEAIISGDKWQSDLSLEKEYTDELETRYDIVESFQLLEEDLAESYLCQSEVVSIENNPVSFGEEIASQFVATDYLNNLGRLPENRSDDYADNILVR